MNVSLYTTTVREGNTFSFSSNTTTQCYLHAEAIAMLRVGTLFTRVDGKSSFIVIGKHINHELETLATYTLICKALTNIPEGDAPYTITSKGYSIAWITLSDSGSVGKRTDESGPLIGNILRTTFDVSLERGFIIPDDPLRIEHLLLELALFQRFHCILTTGGTGLSPRDNTPDVMERILHKTLHGFELAMMQASMTHVSTAILSRAKAGIIAESILINLPGSPKAVEQNLSPLLPALKHAMDKLSGDPTDCAGIFALRS